MSKAIVILGVLATGVSLIAMTFLWAGAIVVAIGVSIAVTHAQG